MKDIFKDSIADSMMGVDMDVGKRRRGIGSARGVETVRATIYVARFSETLQEQFITNIGAIWRVRTLL